jgi:hypothetical protein
VQSNKHSKRGEFNIVHNCIQGILCSDLIFKCVTLLVFPQATMNLPYRNLARKVIKIPSVLSSATGDNRCVYRKLVHWTFRGMLKTMENG